jgi:hypothetical protein
MVKVLLTFCRKYATITSSSGEGGYNSQFSICQRRDLGMAACLFIAVIGAHFYPASILISFFEAKSTAFRKTAQERGCEIKAAGNP